MQAGAVAIPDALVTARIISPQGHEVINNVSCPYNSTYSAYILELLPAWSTGTAGEALTGVYQIYVAVDRFGRLRTKVLKYLVDFT